MMSRFPLKGTVKRAMLLRALLAERKACGRGQRRKHYRSVARRMPTRDQVWAMWTANRRINAGWARQDQAACYVPSNITALLERCHAE
jgi:hypothetical protein